MKKISYYELLKMIKKNNIPDEVIYKFGLSLTTYKAVYDGDRFSHYQLKDQNKENEIISFYLSENFIENEMFEKDILIDTGIYILKKNKKVFRESPEEPQNVAKYIVHLGGYDIKKFCKHYPQMGRMIKDMYIKQSEIISCINKENK